MSLLDPVDEEKLIALAEVALRKLLNERQAVLMQMAGAEILNVLANLLDERRIEVAIEDGKFVAAFVRKP